MVIAGISAKLGLMGQLQIKSPGRRTWARRSATGLAAWMSLAGAAVAAAGFHPAQTPPEVALDNLIRTADGDMSMADNLLARFPVPRGERVDYGRLLTPALIAELRREERQRVKDACGGRYIKGYICGFDFDPLTCAQDFEPKREFQTVSLSGPITIIRFRYEGSEPSANLYRLTREGGTWKIDDILCANAKRSYRKLLSP